MIDFRRIYNNLVHISDWYPTLLRMAQINNYEDSVKNIDGIDQTLALFEDQSTVVPRNMIVNELGHVGIYGIGQFGKKRGILQIEGGWKLLRNPGHLG